MRDESYWAFYEDANKVEAAAKARGFTGNDGESWHDFVEAEHNKFRAAKQFWQLKDAEEWLKREINAMKTVYGCGTIQLQRPAINRCRTCVCGGVRAIHEYTVDDTGIAHNEELPSLCIDDE